MNVVEVIESYRSADEEARIGLFLLHRELREAFLGIDEELAAGETPRGEGGHGPKGGRGSP